MVEQIKHRKIELVFSYLASEMQQAQLKLSDELDLGSKFKTSYLNGLDSSAKQNASNIVKMMRWMISDLGVGTPDAFTDAEVDAINEEIRTQQ